MAEEAEAEIESETPPLFLRFVNLLINDAIFLLDEGLGYMKTLQVSYSLKEFVVFKKEISFRNKKVKEKAGMNFLLRREGPMRGSTTTLGSWPGITTSWEVKLLESWSCSLEE